MAMIFLSYSRKDIDTMYRVKQRLQQADLTVWTDENLIPGTPAWTREIERNLHSCTAVVVMMSPTARESRWVLRECTKAQQKSKPIFPLLIKGNPEDHIPLELCDIQYIDLRRKFDGGLNELEEVFASRGWTKQTQKPAWRRQTQQQTPYFKPVVPKAVSNTPPVQSKKVVTDLDREDAMLCSMEADELFHEKRYQEALKMFTEAIELDPENGEYYEARSDCYAALGDEDSALDDLVRGMELG
jgi:tetratricopeptide (TPR) repeat protein